MYTAVVTIHIIVCIILVLTVLLQQGKGAEVGAVFGSSEAMFGSAGPASALNKLTTIVAVIFMITSLGLTYLAAHRKGNSVMEDVKVQLPVTAPAQQAQPPVNPARQAPKDEGQPPLDVQSKAVEPVSTPGAETASSAGKSSAAEQKHDPVAGTGSEDNTGKAAKPVSE